MTPAAGRRRDLALVLVVAGAAGVLAAAFLPWVRSGSVDRNGFRLARTAERLDLVRGLPFRALVVAYYLLPVGAAATWLTAVLGRRTATAVAGSAVAIVGLAAAAVVLASRLRPAPGVYASLGAGLVALLAAGIVARR
jgi:hypothetical protein